VRYSSAIAFVIPLSVLHSAFDKSDLSPFENTVTRKTGIVSPVKNVIVL
jgi:hypothetical protein